MTVNEEQNVARQVLEYQTLEVPITDRRTEVELDANGAPYSSPTVQSNFPVSTEVNEKSGFPDYYGNNNYYPCGINVAGKHEFPPSPYPVGQQAQLWQVTQTNPDIVVLPAPHYLPQHDHKVVTHLCWSILVTFFCCWPLGLVAISKSGEARWLAEQGNLAEATSKATSAKTYIVISFIIGLLFYCIVGAILFNSLYKLQ